MKKYWFTTVGLHLIANKTDISTIGNNSLIVESDLHHLEFDGEITDREQGIRIINMFFDELDKLKST